MSDSNEQQIGQTELKQKYFELVDAISRDPNDAARSISTDVGRNKSR